MQRKTIHAVMFGANAFALCDQIARDKKNVSQLDVYERSSFKGDFKLPRIYKIENDNEDYLITCINIINDKCLKEGSLDALKDIVRKAEFTMLCPSSLRSRYVDVAYDGYLKLLKFCNSKAHPDIRLADPDFSLGDLGQFEVLMRNFIKFEKKAVLHNNPATQFGGNHSSSEEKLSSNKLLSIVRIR